MKLKLKLIDSKKRKSTNPTGQSQRRKSILRSSGLRTFLVFLILSFAFWLLQSMQRDVVRRIHIPISYDTLSVHQSLTDRIPDYLELEIRDKGIEHVRYALSEPDTIRLKLFKEHKRDYIGISAKALTEAINGRLSSSAQIQQQSFREIRIALQTRASKRVPLRLAQTIRPASGFVVLETRLTPDSLTIYGEYNAIDTISFIPLTPLDLERPRQSVSATATPVLPQSVYAKTMPVQIDMTIEELTEQSFTLPLTILGAPSGYRLSPLPSSATVTLTLPRSYYSQLISTDIELAVDYQDVQATNLSPSSSTTTSQLLVRLIRAPKWIVSYSIQPEVVQYVLEKE